jgi:outer membrane protein
MKNRLSSLCLPVALAFMSFSANAAMILGIDTGVYIWQASSTGKADGVDSSGMEGNNSVAYFALEHPVPFVPNLKLQKTNMTVEAGANSIDLSHADSTLYYEVLDNVVSIDLGLTSRSFNGNFDVGTGIQLKKDTSILAYTSAEVIVPITGLSLGIEMNKDIGMDNNEIIDIKIRGRYEIFSGLGVEFGQRTVRATLLESTPNTNSIEFEGSYLALTYTF